MIGTPFCRIVLAWTTEGLGRFGRQSSRERSHSHAHGQIYGLSWALGAHPPGGWRRHSPLTYYDGTSHNDAWIDGLRAGRDDFALLAARAIGTVEALVLHERARAELDPREFARLGCLGSFTTAIAGRRRARLAAEAFQALADADRALFMRQLYCRRGGEPDPQLSWPGPVLAWSAGTRTQGGAHGSH
jgi:hypothetical protein